MEERFLEISALVCEPTRASMLWNLLDGRAYTASELATVAGVSPTAASNHLARMLEADIVKVENQGRHRYFSFARPEVAYAIEALAHLADHNNKSGSQATNELSGIKYCRSCYDHIAGWVGVNITSALESKKIIQQSKMDYDITNKGWRWLAEFGITKEMLLNKRRPVARQCLDWSERRPHLAGQLGALMLEKMLQQNWFKKMKFSRELIVTSKGKSELLRQFGIELSN